jgi:serine/threonine-protein kinase
MRVCPTCKSEHPDEADFCPADSAILIAKQDPASADPRIGTTLQNGKWLLVAPVADGANGRVYEARDTGDRSRVAIKLLHPEVARDATNRERLRREAETTLELVHPHILHMVGYFTDGPDTHYTVMELLEGEELAKLLAREKQLPLGRSLRIVSQMALALDYAHEVGMIHRDLKPEKPENVFLCKSEQGDFVKVFDFGSVKREIESGPKLTAFGTTLGSPYYMAPEQALALPTLDRRADVFSVGTILYEMLTGKIAFEAPNLAQILFKLLNEEPRPATTQAEGLPMEIDDVLDEALAKQPGLRFPTVSALADALGRALGIPGTPAEWAATPAEDLTRKIGSARPPPAPTRGETTDPVRTEPKPIPETERISLDGYPERPANQAILIAAIAAGVLATIGLGILAWLLA